MGSMVAAKTQEDLGEDRLLNLPHGGKMEQRAEIKENHEEAHMHLIHSRVSKCLSTFQDKSEE
ncbi:hypothetical protein SLEP1_g7469 [Rubroshorea leprosula]|uniref:Uncharacterized protein n=2 Tax=Rubroshorea leprosula TaxID=152421 RepID=A0AAV5I6T4_9ROSI|nr:hypothetical protein SLEP1_g7469 [Rubroshorea leprosula]